jgi:hypothetical protein
MVQFVGCPDSTVSMQVNERKMRFIWQEFAQEDEVDCFA